jgi:N-acyl-D-amino-acid deacylase
MMTSIQFITLPNCLMIILASSAAAGEPPAANRQKIIDAVERGVVVVEKAGRTYPTHRKCFACHHQTLPLLAINEAQAAGARIDDVLPGLLAEFTTTSFRGKLDDLKMGDNIGGKGLTVGYGLWTLRLANTKRDDLTDTMVAYLMKTQEQDGHWDLHAIRPPAEESLVMCTVPAAGGIRHFAGEAQREIAAAAVERARTWLASAKLDSHEDRVARLWGVKLLAGKDDELASAGEALFSTQREDGGWGQTAEMESDAYATGAAVFVLLDTGIEASDAKIQLGVQFLLKTQLEDGSWHVKTRAKPVQVFFDNGDPHGKDQFISIPATGWSVAALARAARELKSEK